MAFATNGAAIIGGKVVPSREVKVLKTLASMNRPATVPEIAAEMGEEMSDASLYSYLGRLEEKRRLVTRQVVEVEVHGTKLRRILWTPYQEVFTFFSTNNNGEKPLQKAYKPAEAPG
jgi:hypothetical protein